MKGGDVRLKTSKYHTGLCIEIPVGRTLIAPLYIVQEIHSYSIGTHTLYCKFIFKFLCVQNSKIVGSELTLQSSLQEKYARATEATSEV